jgi:hypothetical protein
MISYTSQIRPLLIVTEWRKVISSAAFFVLLFPALLMNATSGAAESTYSLVGTVESKGFTGAVIITPDGKQSFYQLRETLPDGAQLVQVHSDSVSLKGSDGSRYEIFITAAGKLQSTAAPGAPAFTPYQAQSPSDKDQQYRPSRHRTHRSSSSDE